MITIIGAGVAGPLLAYMLQKGGVECTILEADPSLHIRHQGGMLNLNENTGQAALQAAGLYQKVLDHVLPGGDALRLLGRDGAVLFEKKGNGSRPEIDRGTLRRIIIEALPENVIRWGSAVRAIERDPKGFIIRMQDDSVMQADLVIGADGAWSCLRSLLTEQKPIYSGITFIELRYRNATRNYPVAKRLVGDGLMFALTKGQGIIGHREPNDELCVYAALSLPEDNCRNELSRAALLSHFDEWAKDYQTLLADSDGVLVPRPIYALPTGRYWPRTPRATLIGDAAHLMSPFAGEGVNLAMADASDLATAILAHRDNFDAALAEYEAKMAKRTTPYQEQSAANLSLAFSYDAPRGFLDFFESLSSDPQSLPEANQR
ncbi:FAD-dependent oxidoreductase [Pararhizobium arenae]|uniref:FAD-dependent oxidoreductase n=1 Tax=Pararhizobium arenae TaxID=1856850 RepID=UPI00094AFDCA|nr:NAD(P)/FAD-dependent oxidoreductase [Pararhizobium arenae]